MFGVKYVRPKVRSYWVFEHKKALGVSFLIFAVSYSIGLSFLMIFNTFFTPNLVAIFSMVVLLIVLAAVVMIGSFVNAHNKVTKIMTLKERRIHSKHVGVFLILFFVGFIFSMIPLIFYTYPGEIMFLLSIGGILLLFYIMAALLFNYKYYELAFASIFLWSIFVITVFLVTPLYFSNPMLFQVISFLITSVTIVTVFGISGIMLLSSSAEEIITKRY